MRYSIKVIVVMITALIMAGCEIGEGELMKTKTGHLMYKGWCEDVHILFMNIVEPTFNAYAWIHAPEDLKPEIFRKYFFSNVTIETLPDLSWEIQIGNRARLCMFFEDGPALSEPGGKVHLYYNNTCSSNESINNKRFVLENKGNGVWEIHSDDAKINFKLSLDTSEMPESLTEMTMSLEGQGTFMHTTVIHQCSGDVCQDEIHFTSLSYDIQQPFEGEWVLGNSSYWYDFITKSNQLALQSGKVALQALDENGYGSGNAATITVLNTEEIEIEMDGIVQRRKI